MKRSIFLNPIRFSILLITCFAFVAVSCEKADEPFAEGTPEVQADLAGYGNCGSCPLPSTISGTLPAQLYPSSAWMVNLENCFEEDLSHAGPRCSYKTTGTYSLTENINVYLQFSTNPANTLASFCSYFYQVGNALSSNRPSGNWLLHEVNYMSHLYGSNYKINVTWRAYVCEHIHHVKVK